MQAGLREQQGHHGQVEKKSSPADDSKFQKSDRKVAAGATQTPQLLGVQEHDLSGKFRFTIRPRAEGIWNFLDARGMKSRENFQEDFESSSVQLVFYFGEILAPNQKIPRHWIF